FFIGLMALAYSMGIKNAISPIKNPQDTHRDLLHTTQTIQDLPISDTPPTQSVPCDLCPSRATLTK
ncbi:MAG: hypothetical protein QHH07_06860, partial [Sedimentisphaerales bacterium]|nr:hypothetical protein [Sedimentisphaerales bacterium]